MGADIHFHPEVQDPDTGTWHPTQMCSRETFDAVFPYYASGGEQGAYGTSWYEVYRTEDEYSGTAWPSGRNYRFFSLVGDVRNYNGAEPLYAGRGIPSDISSEVQASYDRWDVDAHSPSHATLRELMHEALAATKMQGWMETLQDLSTLAPSRKGRHGALDLDAVRMVFWFDN